MSNPNSLVGISPKQFIHVLDKNTNITRLEVGPRTFHLQTNEEIVLGPASMICVPPGFYCSILNPVREYEAGVKCELNLGQVAIRLHGDPFPLFPGEVLLRVPDFGQKTKDYSSAILQLPVVPANCALRLCALQDHLDEDDEPIPAGHIWQVEGPMTYIPRPEVEIQQMVKPDIIKAGEVLRLRAIQDTTDRNGLERVTGEEWLIREPGAYLRGVWEEMVGIEKNITLTADSGLHLRATQNIKKFAGKPRVPGDEWILTGDVMQEYSPRVGVELVKQVKKLVVKKGQYAVIIDPVGPDGKNRLGTRFLRSGLCSFFLQPGESLEDGKIKNASILTADDSLVLQASEQFTDTMFDKPILRKPGDKWMIRGPLSYIPPITVQIVNRRNTIPLSKNEGVYVQNTKTGKVRAVMGPCAYMLTADEELWQKTLPPEAEDLLMRGGGSGSEDIRKIAYFEQSIDPAYMQGRDKSRVVTFRCPGNTAVQVSNYQHKTSRIVFGPDLVVLGPDENFVVQSLSAGRPKKTDALKTLCLMLGPDFISDIIEVETSDHARLRLQVAFNNHFEVDKSDEESVKKIFQVPDFIGFACRQLGSRIRASVALTPFDAFHKHSAQIIKDAVFGRDDNGKRLPYLMFEVNNLVISSIDIQNIEPVDTKMRDSLMKSVQLAIEIATKSVEASATHEANRREQIAKGELERQRLMNEVEAEKERAKLYELRAEAAAVESTGQAKAEAQAEAEKTLIECQSEITAVTLKAQAEEIAHYCKLDTQSMIRAKEIEYKRRLSQLEIDKEKRRANLEVAKFASMVSTLGSANIASIARAGPQMKLKMLSSLGMQSVLLTDGSSPINLFNTAEGLIGGIRPSA